MLLKKIIPVLIPGLLLVTTCKKNSPEFREGGYRMSGSASYTFDSGSYIVDFETKNLVLVSYSEVSVSFLLREINGAGATEETSLLFTLSGNDADGHWSGSTEYNNSQLIGQVEIENGEKKITGEMSFEVVHEYLIYDGPFTYPASTTVTAAGPFQIEPW